MDWQPIETAPRDGTRVLLYCAGGDIAAAEYVVASDGFAGWEVSHTETSAIYLAVRATHWMPLPPPPTPSAESASAARGETP